MDIQIKADTIARTIVFILALVNQGLALFGKEKINIAENDIYQLVSFAATIVTGIWAWWKNNSFTTAARIADNYMKGLKENSVK